MALRVLWLSHFVPYPPKGGNTQRSYNLLAQLGARHEIHLLAMRPKPAASPEAATGIATPALGRHCASVEIIDHTGATRPAKLARLAATSVLTGQPMTVTLFRSAEARGRFRDLLARVPFDVVHFDSISLAEYVPLAGALPTAMTHHGAEAWMIKRRIRNERSLARRAFFGVEWLALARVERRTLPRVGVNLVCSALDQRLLGETIGQEARYAVVENGVDVDYFRPQPPTGGRSLIFAGRLDQYSNRDAILHFMATAWPIVAARFPDVSIRIIGLNPPEHLRTLAAADPRIQVLGFVDDVRPHFAASAVALCPIRDGGGTRVKVLDALALGRPLVATTIGCEGLDVEPDRHVLIGDTPETFAAQIGRLFEDPALGARLAREGRAQVEARYAWPALGARFAAALEGVAATRRAGARP
jgi:glycosyltransferase involved in cell wall biosynthesis